MRQIDKELNDAPAPERIQLWTVLDRYTSWLERLDDKDRQRIESASDTTEKIKIIKELRQREWVSHLPKAQRDWLGRAALKDRAAQIEQLRRAEKERRAEWSRALREQNDVAPPRVAQAFWEQVRLYEVKSLYPALNPIERKELDRAAHLSWPEHARKLRELAARYGPIKVPPAEHLGVIRLQDVGLGMPPLGGGFMGRRGGGGHHMEGDVVWHLLPLQGRWPDFALEVDRLAKEGKMRRPTKLLGPCTPQEFVPPVRQFIDELRKDPAAARKLDEAKGKWPDYPFAVMSLAREKNLKVPGTYLPDSKEDWNPIKGQE